ncbi:MAG: hypothetical protein VX589_07760 [Myxococcota bacterium]|nr:hypothetical protein [Myxococcota bacterium]
MIRCLTIAVMAVALFPSCLHDWEAFEEAAQADLGVVSMGAMTGGQSAIASDTVPDMGTGRSFSVVGTRALQSTSSLSFADVVIEDGPTGSGMLNPGDTGIRLRLTVRNPTNREVGAMFGTLSTLTDGITMDTSLIAFLSIPAYTERAASTLSSPIAIESSVKEKLAVFELKLTQGDATAFGVITFAMPVNAREVD